jgi:hypothetical protein
MGLLFLVRPSEHSCLSTAENSADTSLTASRLTGFLATLALDVWPLSRHIPIHPRFSASSRGLSHVHHDHSDGEDRVEIPQGIEVRRLPMMTRNGIVGYGNGWTDRTDGEEDISRDFAWYEMGKEGRREKGDLIKRRRRSRSSYLSSSTSS